MLGDHVAINAVAEAILVLVYPVDTLLFNPNQYMAMRRHDAYRIVLFLRIWLEESMQK